MTWLLASGLRRLFQVKAPMDPMMSHTTRPPPDPIGVALGAAVQEHARVMDAEASNYRRRLRETMAAIDDVFNRLEKRDANG